MHEAAMYGHADVVESLILSHGNLHEICDQTGITPLHLAAKHMHFQGMYWFYAATKCQKGTFTW